MIGLKGDLKALSPAEEKGLATFIEVGCVGCHYGATLGGTSYRKLGERNEYKTQDLEDLMLQKNETEKFF